MTKTVLFCLKPNDTDQSGTSGGDTRTFTIINHLLASNKIDLTTIGTNYLYKKIDYKKIKNKVLIPTGLISTNQVDILVKSILILVKYILFFRQNFEGHVIYSGSDLPWDVLPALFHQKKNKWIQCIYHNYPDWKTRAGNKVINFSGFYIQKLMHKLIKKYADKVIVINPITKKELIDKGFNPKKIYLNYCGINPKTKINKTTKKEGVVSISRFSPSKGIHNLIKVWEEVIKAIPNAQLYIIGGNAKDKYYQDTISSIKNKKNIHNMGYVSEQKKIKILKKTKIFATCSTEEGFNITILEALQYNLHVVAYKLPVYSAIYKKNINQVDHNTKKMAKLIIKIIKNKKSRPNNLKFIKQFSWHNIVKREYDIIKK